ncbi:MAG: hypothetical protein ABF289_07415 [Clostridiales bacterium]
MKSKKKYTTIILLFFIIIFPSNNFQKNTFENKEMAIDNSSTSSLDEILKNTTTFEVLNKSKEFQSIKGSQSDINELDINLPFNFRPLLPVFLTDNTFLFIAYTFKNTVSPTETYIYKYNLKTKSLEKIHSLKLYINAFTEHLHKSKYSKILENGNIVFKLTENILIIDKTNLNIIKNIHIPNNYRNSCVDISKDGKKILYTDENGLYTDSIDFSNQKKIFNLKNSDYSILNPLWSDNNSIVFNLYQNKLIGTCIIKNNSKNVNFIKTNNLTTETWFKNSYKMIGTIGNVDSKKIAIIDFKNKFIEKYPIKNLNYCGTINPKYNNKFYLVYDYGICIFDYKNKTQTKYKIYMKFDELQSGSWSPQGKELINISNRKFQLIKIK